MLLFLFVLLLFFGQNRNRVINRWDDVVVVVDIAVVENPGNLSLKFHQIQVSNSLNIADIKFCVVGGVVVGVQSHFHVKTNLC